MSTRFIQLWGRLLCLLMLFAFVEHRAIALDMVEYGTVTGIEIYRAPDSQPINAGTLIGGIAGDVIGHQIGSGRGNTAATIVGALGGAAVGNQIEKNTVQRTRYRISVRLDSGSSLMVEEYGDVNPKLAFPISAWNIRND